MSISLMYLTTSLLVSGLVGAKLTKMVFHARWWERVVWPSLISVKKVKLM